MAFDRCKTFALAWSGNTYVFAGGGFSYRTVEDTGRWQYSGGVHDFTFNRLDLFFSVYLGYLGQQLNAGTSYTLANATVIASAPAVGVIDVLNILKESNATTVDFYPKMEDDMDTVDQTHYRVLGNNSETVLLTAEKAGRIQPYVPVKMMVKTPLQDYPSFANR